MSQIVIIDTGIKQDEQGRYCLNDLHRASGGANKHRPSLWLKNMQTMALIDEMEKAGIPAIESKQQLGTFVGKELVYAYAMWISPAFHLQVIRTFDAVATKQADPMDVLNDPAAMRNLLLTYTEKVIALETKVSERDKLISNIQPQAEALQRLSMANGSLCITDAAKTLQIQPKKLFAVLQEHKWVYRRTGCNHWVGYQDKLQQQLLEHKTTTVSRSDGSEKIAEQVRITPKGLSKLSTMLPNIQVS